MDRVLEEPLMGGCFYPREENLFHCPPETHPCIQSSRTQPTDPGRIGAISTTKQAPLQPALRELELQLKCQQNLVSELKRKSGAFKEKLKNKERFRNMSSSSTSTSDCGPLNPGGVRRSPRERAQRQAKEAAASAVSVPGLPCSPIDEEMLAVDGEQHSHGPLEVPTEETLMSQMRFRGSQHQTWANSGLPKDNGTKVPVVGRRRMILQFQGRQLVPGVSTAFWFKQVALPHDIHGKDEMPDADSAIRVYY